MVVNMVKARPAVNAATANMCSRALSIPKKYVKSIIMTAKTPSTIYRIGGNPLLA
jgi:hypothetical protein